MLFPYDNNDDEDQRSGYDDNTDDIFILIAGRRDIIGIGKSSILINIIFVSLSYNLM